MAFAIGKIKDGLAVGWDSVASEDEAIKMIKGVQGVSLNVANSDDYLNRERVKSELKKNYLKY